MSSWEEALLPTARPTALSNSMGGSSSKSEGLQEEEMVRKLRLVFHTILFCSDASFAVTLFVSDILYLYIFRGGILYLYIFSGGEYKNIVIMCGAGISVNAGIPDFRSHSAGTVERQHLVQQNNTIFCYSERRPYIFYHSRRGAKK